MTFIGAFYLAVNHAKMGLVMVIAVNPERFSSIGSFIHCYYCRMYSVHHEILTHIMFNFFDQYVVLHILLFMCYRRVM